MRRKIIGCTIKRYVGRLIEFDDKIRHLTIDGTTFTVAYCSNNKIFSYNCIFILEAT